MTKGIEKMAEVRYYGLGILAHINNTKKGRVDDHFDINSVLFLFREPDIFLLIRYSPFLLSGLRCSLYEEYELSAFKQKNDNT